MLKEIHGNLPIIWNFWPEYGARRKVKVSKSTNISFMENWPFVFETCVFWVQFWPDGGSGAKVGGETKIIKIHSLRMMNKFNGNLVFAVAQIVRQIDVLSESGLNKASFSN